MTLKSITLLLISSAATAPTYLASASERTDTTGRNLQELVVTARNKSEDVIPVQALQGDELQRLNSNSIADALRYFAGVQVKDYGGVGGIKTVNIRSMGTNHTGVVYDGVELGNAQNGQIALGMSPTTSSRCHSTTARKARYCSRQRISAQPAPSTSIPGPLTSRRVRTITPVQRYASVHLT